ncbi:MAG: hypothetical protein D6698_16490, partial [Gammaproteobacteria bacterium]
HVNAIFAASKAARLAGLHARQGEAEQAKTCAREAAQQIRTVLDGAPSWVRPSLVRIAEALEGATPPIRGRDDMPQWAVGLIQARVRRHLLRWRRKGYTAPQWDYAEWVIPPDEREDIADAIVVAARPQQVSRKETQYAVQWVGAREAWALWAQGLGDRLREIAESAEAVM